MTAPYLSRASLAVALEIGESTVDDMVRRGALPEAENGFWEWAQVDAALQSLSKISGRRVTVYVVGFGSYIKIGFTAGPIEYRLAGIQTGAPEQLKVFKTFEGTTATEASLHRRFATYRNYGEWFRFEGDLAAWIEAGCPQ